MKLLQSVNNTQLVEGYQNVDIDSQIDTLISCDVFDSFINLVEIIEFPNNVKQLILADYAVNNDIKHHNVIYLNCFLLWQINRFRCYKNQISSQKSSVITNIFNFQINRIRTNRILLIGALDYYHLTNYQHTLTWKDYVNNDDVNKVLLTMNSKYFDETIIESFRYNKIPQKLKKFTNDDFSINGKFYIYDSDKLDNVLRYTLGMNVIYESSMISLITESIGVAKAVMFTEKTVYAIIGLTFPIWVGGYGEASKFKELGFDIFDDIIDHSYQFEDSPLDRCFMAIKLNLKLLSDFDYSYNLWNLYINRMINNKKYMLSSKFSSMLLDPILKLDQDSKKLLNSRYKNILKKNI